MNEIARNVFVEVDLLGVNVGAIATSEGWICIDSPTIPKDARDWYSRLVRSSGMPIRYLILTDYHTDRVLNAHRMQARIIAHEESQARLDSYETRYPSSVLEQTTLRYDLSRQDISDAVVAHPQITFCDQATLQVGEQNILLVNMPSATPGSTWVYLKKEGILFTGDTIVVNEHPPLAEAETDRWLDAFQILRQNQFRAKWIIPGRGPLCELSATDPLAEYIQLAQNRVYTLFQAGRPRADTSSLVSDLYDSFPLVDTPREWLQKQIKMGLDHIYDEYKAMNGLRRQR